MSSTDQADVQDNDYVSRAGQKQDPIPVQSDGADVEDPISAETANSDEQLGEINDTSDLAYLILILNVVKDDNDAIDRSNVINERTRGAKPSGGYREPGDEEGLPGPEDGTSSGRQ
ncbi:hypothetical protein D0Z07_4066 [Hyphodiscus hymeniophilus]|uniref:Uncharacterized protein n=1 Tax=Hyphodiscus hymeniophilus TaxID=353542 RepID=A0A9P6VKI0_9HELO|nr:hypothetical protein D0Z07_4066 [Hyphodiscus hymeniophilus]